ncbi:MAG: TatD family hydrolase [Spirochaetia bacterium]|nr:TatD family hydrolase [Spirochaetia bacterium]
MNLFDTHAHIGLIHDDPIEQLIVTKEAKQADVKYIISICNNIKDFGAIYDNLTLADNVLYAVGLSPAEVDNLPSNWEEQIIANAAKAKVVAIGETGLDYYRKFGNKNAQIELFRRQLTLAEKLNKPVIVHNREAGEDIYNILKTNIPSKGAVLHCYSEDWNYAKKILDLNVMFSFAGNLTYKNARNLHETVRNLPEDRILLETEAPFMIPAVYRGKRNKPAYLKETLKFLAGFLNRDPEELADIIYKNSLHFFNISE